MARPCGKLLKPGQRLVSTDGDLWRWDGFAQAAEAPTPAARRLAEKNRLGDLRIEAEAAREAAEAARLEAERTRAELAAAASSEQDARQRLRLAAARGRGLARAERRGAAAARGRGGRALEALDDAGRRISPDLDEATDRHAQAASALGALEAPTDLDASLEAARADGRRGSDHGRRGPRGAASLLREAEARGKRLVAIESERKSWQSAKLRRRRADRGFRGADRAKPTAEYRSLVDAPDTFAEARRSLLDRIEAAEAACKADGRHARRGADAASRRPTRRRGSRSRPWPRRARRWPAARRGSTRRALRHDEVLRAITAEQDDRRGKSDPRLAEIAGLAPTESLPEAGPVEARLERPEGRSRAARRGQSARRGGIERDHRLEDQARRPSTTISPRRSGACARRSRASTGKAASGCSAAFDIGQRAFPGAVHDASSAAARPSFSSSNRTIRSRPGSRSSPARPARSRRS